MCFVCRGRRLELVSLSLGASPTVKLSLHAHYTSSSEVSTSVRVALADAQRAVAIGRQETPLMHRRLALMLLASARALRPIASLRGGARTLRRASAAPSMSDTHRAASSTAEGLRDRRGFAIEATPHHTGTSTTSSSAPARAASPRRAARRRMVRNAASKRASQSSRHPLRRRQGRRLREGRARRHLRQRGLRAEEGHVQRGAHHGVRP